MEFKINKSKCAGCRACLRACPYGAIKIGEDKKAFIDQSKCKKCGMCQKICPFDAIEKILDEGEEPNPELSPPSLPQEPFSNPPPCGLPPVGGKGLGRGRGPGWSRGMGRKW